ncbi:AMP-binding protein [Pseudonocardia asaccharolytica]|uniref:Coenzyme F390 synthetase n=1 Tax=Pseudonocardia asaccharolytica DSM 44247 = NBRC 16224 TaxID=1123024 RepID=A0A511D2V7_9PSEU|nr:AMP-binding protein [Pseudonocardia asaccharolytica]GEL19111.1 coenzyme F390 synthetase [Pseudonocardia asaccharolytica DSM 44247 = NBRC 16224]
MTATTATSPFVALRDRTNAALLAAYPELIARLDWDRARIVAHQRLRLQALLAHAAAHSPFHSRRLRGIDLDAVGPADLATLPVMTKAEMMNELDDVFTDRRLTHRAVEEALAAAGREPAVLQGVHLALASGGSTGQRAVFVLDGPACVQFYGSLTRGFAARIAATGGPPGGLPAAMVAAGSPLHATGTAGPLTAGGRLPFRFHSVPVTLPLPEIVERLNALQAPLLFGYPTMLARLAGEQRAGRLRIAPVAVTCTSETCTPELRAAITAGFGAPLIDGFGSTEGLVGNSPPGEEAIVFAEDGCVLELVDDRNRPVPPGTSSAKVLVTNLYNQVQPLIRYELTDRFVAEPPAAGHGHLRARVQGRSDEVFRYGAVTVHPLVMRSVLVQTPEVLEYQVRQTPGGIDVAAVADPGLDVAGLQRRLAAALAGSGLARPEVVVRPVPNLQRHPETGKLCRFIPLR